MGPASRHVDIVQHRTHIEHKDVRAAARENGEDHTGLLAAGQVTHLASGLSFREKERESAYANACMCRVRECVCACD
jgi:hypothetical protein